MQTWSPWWFALYLPVAAIVLANCQNRLPEPVAIAPEDMCSFCKMAISEKRYAAEFIDSDGQTFKFDDIGCMIDFIRARNNAIKVSAQFVVDFDNKQWVNAAEAYYVHTPEIKTPMGGDTIAFKEEAKAQRAAAEYRGRLLRYNDLLNL
ncbi:MAG TPA: nitrous oxide reductase accessory protein NosL [Pyrinomonadaceae bacterium]|nr:nitrous oxide reductase accessory protein NosL [Pyrinomonadaceae bacterium]